jgi:DNA/RNA endonuclease YhcR with UshA esterase domain
MFSAGAKGTLDDGTGTATLLLWQDVYDGLADRSRLVPGAVVDVQGEVGLYQGELEVIPRLPAHLSVTGLVELPADRRTVGQVSSADAGQVIELSGRVVEARSFSRGMRYLLDDDTGTITLLLWQDIYERAAQPDLLAVGAEVLVRGEVAEYLGELEIVPRMPEDVQVTALAGSSMGRPTAPAGIATSSKASPVPAGTLTPEPTVATPEPTAEPVLSPTPQATATPAFETRTIGAISGDDVGRTFTIARAGIGDVDFFSRGVKYRLEDGSGSMILLVWQNVLEEVVARYDLVPGSLVEVTGEVDEYAGDLEIIPHDGTGLQVLAVGERLPIEERAAADVTASDEGRIFAVQGAVVRTESADWLKVWLGDGTGEILIFVPERTVPYLPAGIGAGVRLRVTGSVDIYQGVVEIIPLAGVDVEVLGP